MSRNLPPDFLRERKPILGAEWEDFLQSYDTPRAYGLRRNPFQGCDTLPFSLKPVAWAEDGYYFDPEGIRSTKPVPTIFRNQVPCLW